MRDLPTSLLLAFVLWIASALSRMVFGLVIDEPWSAMRFQLAMEGLGFASSILAVVGMRELTSRTSGLVALGCRIATIGVALYLVVDLGWTMLPLKDGVHAKWIYKAMQYASWAGTLGLVIGVTIAAWNRIGLAVASLVVNLVAYPPPILHPVLFGWLPKQGTAATVVPPIFTIVRLTLLFVAVASVVRIARPVQPQCAADGLRMCGRALWARVIATVGVVMLTILLIGGSGGRGSFELLRLAMMSAAVINILALWHFGAGALLAARAGVDELSSIKLGLAGSATLWAAGVNLTQLPFLYRMLYRESESSWAREMAQGLPLAVPLVVTGGVALVALAIGSYAAHRSREELVVEARARGFGFVALMLTSLGIQSWLVTEAKSRGSFATFSLLGAAAGLIATVLLAKLCTRAADDLTSEPGLPTATIRQS